MALKIHRIGKTVILQGHIEPHTIEEVYQQFIPLFLQEEKIMIHFLLEDVQVDESASLMRRLTEMAYTRGVEISFIGSTHPNERKTPLTTLHYQLSKVS